MNIEARAASSRWRVAAIAISAIAGLLAGFGNLGAGLEQNLRELSADLRSRDASGTLHIVEIDARSIAAVARWPWPRANYAQVVDRLREAGAASIAFDVDFSSHSDAANDAAFSQALARTDNKVILPTFGQYSGGAQSGWIDSLPIPILRDHATLAAVSIRPDSDGSVRYAPIGTVTRGVPRPSLSAMLANADGVADSEFLIDFAIDPLTIPRHSFVAVRDGKFDPSEFAGKNVLIGATAIEMGDRYAVPNHGVIPGVVIQALAAETLVRGVPREAGWVLPLLLGLACAAPILGATRRRSLLGAIAAAPAAICTLGIVAQSQFNWIFSLTPGLIVLGCASMAAIAMRLLVSAQRRRSRDVQTGLPNRLALRHTPDCESQGILVARFADFDKLSAMLGVEATGDLIRRVHDRIVLIAEGNTVYRVEDRVLAWQCSDLAALEERVAALRTMMLNPVEVAGRRIDVTLVLGVAFREEHEDADSTLGHAMMAADHALARGEAWHLHDPQEEQTADLELSLLSELDEAIVNGDIHVAYQPKLCLKTETIRSVEALVRWNHRTRGPLLPDLFIPLAERSDRIASLTLHVVERTMQDLASWQIGGHEITGAVNISAKLLNSSSFLAAVRQLLARSPVEPSKLTFEVTESAAMTNAEEAAAALRSFRDLGIAISMDDYGTGQSTLSYLKQLPLNELKIDRSFVQFAHQNRGDGLLVQSTINLAHDLGLTVVAEGVEDAECLAFLRSVGCDYVQGYLIGKPVGPTTIKTMLTPLRTDAA